MDNINEKCHYCLMELTGKDEIVACSKCGAKVHKECWIKNKGCTTFGCEGNMQSMDPINSNLNIDNNIEFCATCGEKNVKGNRFCSFCGNQLLSYNQNQFNNANYSNENEFRRFVIVNPVYYIDKFNRMKQGNTRVSWNWAAFLLAGYWCFYRRMYMYGAILVVIRLVAAFIPVANYISFGASIIMGLYGNSFYMKYAEGNIDAAKGMFPAPKQQYYAEKGGTSMFASIVSIIVSLLILSFKF